MQILGLFTNSSPRNHLKTLLELHNAQLSIPIVFMLEDRRCYTFPDHISIFPAFCSVNRRATIPHKLAQLFFTDEIARAIIFELSIYLIDSSDMPSVYALAEDMAVFFPRVEKLNLSFERRCEIVSFLLTIDEYNQT